MATLPGDVQLVLFDMAGTTVDDDVGGVPLVIAAFRVTFRKHNSTELRTADCNAVRGYEKREALRRLRAAQKGCAPEAVENGEVEQLFSIFKKELDKLTACLRKEVAGTTETFAALRARGVKVCVGSGFPEPVVATIMTAMGWQVDGYFSSDALGAGRPDPIMVRAAMEHCGVVDPRRVVKVGDTVVDVEEGKNAGCWTVAVLTGTQSREKLATAGPDHIIASVADLPALLEPSANM